TLYKQLKKLPWAAVPAVSTVSMDRGRRARRTIKAVLAPAWIEFDGAAQVAQLRRTVTKKGKKTVEVVYIITSDRDADPATLAAGVRSHWESEVTRFAPLLEPLDLTGAVVTADALHTQREHAGFLVTRKHAHYILVVKKNQPGLHASSRTLPGAASRSATA